MLKLTTIAILATIVTGCAGNDGNVNDFSHFMPLSDFKPVLVLGIGNDATPEPAPPQRQNYLPEMFTKQKIYGSTYINSSKGTVVCNTIYGTEYCN